MPEFRYANPARWWKGNTHIHSTVSDGGKNFVELADLYTAAGYHFLFRTDHWVASDVRSDSAPYPLLWLDGVELDGVDSTGAGYHVVGLGSFQGIERGMGLEAAMQAIKAQGGMLILAHPHWMGNTFEDTARWSFDGVEVYNHVCRWLNGKGDGGSYWSAMLSASPNMLAFAVDDAHLNTGEPVWNGGWVMVNAAECTSEAIIAALKAGRFYASCGPQIESMDYDGEKLSVQCSPIQYARLVGPRWHGARTGAFDGQLLTTIEFKVPQAWQYAYLEIEDDQGRRAWTNPLFVAA
jgi:hypothetical protein